MRYVELPMIYRLVDPNGYEIQNDHGDYMLYLRETACTIVRTFMESDEHNGPMRFITEITFNNPHDFPWIDYE